MLDHHEVQPDFASGVPSGETEVEKLEARLHRGWQIIEAREAAGKPTEHLVEHFMELLRDYEAAYRVESAA